MKHNRHTLIRKPGAVDDWYTPPEIVKALGPFDLDVCSSVNRPFNLAKRHLCKEKVDSLNEHWTGRVWMNPPYGREIKLWMQKLSGHGNGIALVFSRTDTSWFHESVWRKAAAVAFTRRRITFYRADGSLPGGKITGSVFAAYGKKNALSLSRACASGKISAHFVSLT